MDITSINNLGTGTLAAQLGVQANAAPQLTADQRAMIQSVKAAVQVVNAAQPYGADNKITFFVDRKAGQVVVRIVNSDTGKVVNQIPNEQVLAMAEEYSSEQSKSQGEEG